jgi:hypothetical protein
MKFPHFFGRNAFGVKPSASTVREPPYFFVP